MSVAIYIARHGQNEDNVNGILNGHRDLPLTDIGRQQARELGQAIEAFGLEFDAVYCSPLIRAHETADIIADTAQLVKPVVNDLLIERNFGSMTGELIDRIEELCGPRVIKTSTITYFIDAEGAETFPQLVERGHKVLEFVRNKHAEGRVLLVCHGDIGKMIYCAATGKEWLDVLHDFHFGNGELIDIEDTQVHKVRLEQYNL